MEKNAIVVNGLTKKFGELVAVDNISFSVAEGEIFGFLGPNGAGKTTTIRMLCTLSRPTRGHASIAGHDIGKEKHRVREQIGLVSEKLIMYDRLTARENLKLFGKLYDIPNKKLKSKMAELLDLVHMEKWVDKQIGTYSTGMKQRINVIRALLNEPKVLFLDEPTLGLDPQSTAEIREFIRKINKASGTTIILTTHMMVEADLLCDRIGIIDRGKIVALDTPENLKKMISGTSNTILEIDIANMNSSIRTKLEELDTVNKVTLDSDTKLTVRANGDDAFDNIIDTIRGQNGKITRMKNLEPTLEDVFLHLTGRTVRDETTDKVRTAKRRRGPGGHGARSGGSRRVR
ncbi:MAG: ATP-binding cassette domain-containing protein [Candidatus Thermoplasmatota archaeon]|nr:ATP-binding cassette domain-containing protein [Candidatus Thermoplasmatota archaeon]